ncbi:MAG: hypothetical protein R2824_08430 [Saprospiraceae bacterium]|nr:hypothetical protein [Lewinella sp.]
MEADIKSDQTVTNESGKRIRLKLSLLGIELEAVGYASEELATVMKAITIKVNLIMIFLILTLIVNHLSEWVQSIVAFFQNSS